MALCLTTPVRAADEAPPAAPRERIDQLAYWSEGEIRPFVSLVALGGLVNAVSVAGGYGKPHWIWAGAEVDAVTTFDFGAVALGPRIAAVVGDLSFKRRFIVPFRHVFVPRRASYDSDDLVAEGEETANHQVWDLNLWGLFPLPHGFGNYELGAMHVGGVPDGHDVFEEYSRVVTREGWLYIARLGVSSLLFDEKLATGVLAEYIAPNERDSTFRLGPAITWLPTDHFSVTAVYTFQLISPDSLDWFDGAWGTLRARYAWASGEARPAFP